MIRSGRNILFLFCITLSLSIHAQPSMMTEVNNDYLKKLVRIALENYPRVKTNNVRIDIAQNNISRAKLAWFEVLSFYYLYSPHNSTTLINPNFLNGYQFGLSLNVGSLLQKPAQVRISKDELQLAQLQKQEYELNLEANVKDRYYQYVQQLTILKARTQSALDATTMMTALRNKFERGEETFENYNRALVVYNEQTQLKINAEAGLLTAKASLEELLNKKLEEIGE